MSSSATAEATQEARAKIKMLDEQVEARCAAASAHGANSKPISRLFRTLHDIHAQAEIYSCEGDDERCYMMLMLTCRYYLHIIAKHGEFNAKLVRREKEQAARLCEQAITGLEQLRASLLRTYEREWMDAERAEEHRQQQQRELQEAAAVAAALAKSQPTPSPEPPLTPIPIQPPPAVGGIASPSGNGAVSPAQFSSSEPAPHTPSPYPSVLPAASAQPLASAPSAPDFPAVAAGARDAALPIQPAAPQPQPQPSVSRARSAPDIPDTLRPIHLPRNVLADFYAFAANNTLANIETCGILCGKFDSASRHLWITHVLIPNQHATADTCVTTDEEQLIELQTQFDLLTLGWIHTHPSQTCFLSSVDLHTHFSYQLMLSEAIAIVLAPKHSPNSGVFHCTLPGMKALTSCSRSGFHKHEEPFPLFAIAPHYIWEDDQKHAAKFMDLRVQPRAQPPPGYVQPQPHPHAHSHGHSHNHSHTHSHQQQQQQHLQQQQQPQPHHNSAYPQL